MKRSVLLSIMFIAGALGVMAFSAAQFTDYEFTTSNAIQAGTLDLNSTATITCTFPADGLEGIPSSPDATDSQASCPYTLTHTGTLLNAELYARLSFAGVDCEAAGTNDAHEFCDNSDDLTADEFHLIGLTLGTGTPPALGWATRGGSILGTNTTCLLLYENFPVGTTGLAGNLTVELDQTLTSNVMQGDALVITLHFELAEDGATGIDCIANADDSTAGT